MARTDRRPRQRLSPAARREGILEAASQAFASQPYESVSMIDIARQVGSSEALLYRYFSSKSELYAEVIRQAMGDLLRRQSEALHGLPSNASPRDKLAASLDPYFDYLAGASRGWLSAVLNPASDPAEAAAVRAETLEGYVGSLSELLGARATDDYALHGYFGFLDAACLVWVRRGCPAEGREPLKQAALGALFGALSRESCG